jgi:hypothetical protein
VSYKVSFQGFNGVEGEESMDDSGDDPLILEFDTKAERSAFIRGCNMTAEVMHGWLEAAIEVKSLVDLSA